MSRVNVISPELAEFLKELEKPPKNVVPIIRVSHDGSVTSEGGWEDNNSELKILL